MHGSCEGGTPSAGDGVKPCSPGSVGQVLDLGSVVDVDPYTRGRTFLMLVRAIWGDALVQVPLGSASGELVPSTFGKRHA